MSTDYVPLLESRILYDTVRKTLSNSSLQLQVYEVDDLSQKDMDSCLKILDENLGETYKKVNGRNWKVGKRKEMKELGLVYILIIQDVDICGFISLKIINEYDLCTLYLYEIQLDGSMRGRGLGTELMHQLENIAKALQNSKKLKKIWYNESPDDYTDLNDPELEISGIGLTVFNSNKGARKFYKKLGFVLHPSSPTDKCLRDGKVIEPDYYMLEKKI